MTRVVLSLALILSLAACESRINPLNWFGGDREERITVAETDAGLTNDPRPLVSEIVALSVEATTSGVIVRATGRVPTQGYYDAELVEAARDGSTLIYEFRATPPAGAAPQGAAPTREIVAAADLSRGDLEGVRSIMVIAQGNRRTVSRQ